MKLRLFLSTCILVLCNTLIGNPAQPETANKAVIKVLLAKDTNSTLLEAKGPFRVVRDDTGMQISSGRLSKRFVAHAIQDGLRWGEEYPDVYALSIIPESKHTSLYVNGFQYDGVISITHSPGNRITVVNYVHVDDFLKSVLPLKINENMSQELLAALVITERTNIYAQVNSSLHPKQWDVKAEDVRYFGKGVSKQRHQIDQALAATHDMILESKRPKSVVEIHLELEKAAELAERGFNARKILEFSFPHSHITSLDMYPIR